MNLSMEDIERIAELNGLEFIDNPTKEQLEEQREWLAEYRKDNVVGQIFVKVLFINVLCVTDNVYVNYIDEDKFTREVKLICGLKVWKIWIG